MDNIEYNNNSDIITLVDLADEINEMYIRFIRAQFFIGGIVLITTLTNMSLLCSIKNKLKEIKNCVIPPLYKPSNY